MELYVVEFLFFAEDSKTSTGIFQSSSLTEYFTELSYLPVDVENVGPNMASTPTFYIVGEDI